MMSLIPFLFDDSFDYRRPSKILEQKFGVGLSPEDLLAPFTIPGSVRALITLLAGYVRPWRTQASEQDVGSTVKFDRDEFQANLDVEQFKPEGFSVKVTGDNQITIEGKHEETQDDHGSISRQFVRRYVLPKDCDFSKIESKLSSDGVLTIEAPRIGDMQIQHREVPITATWKPSKPIEQKKEAASGDKK